MDDIGFSQLYITLNQLKDKARSENIVDQVYAFELLSDAIQELHTSRKTISALEDKLAQATQDLAKYKMDLDKEKALMAEVLKQMPAGVVVLDARTGKAIRINRTAKMIMGSENVLSRSMEDHKSEGGPILLHPDKTPYEFEEIPLIRSVLQSEVVKNEEIIYIRKDGVKGVLSISSAPIFDNDSKVIAVVATFSDTAQHK